MLDWNQFWIQLLSPLNNSISIFFAVLIALLTQRLIKEFEDANLLLIGKPSNFLEHLGVFIIRFTVAFLIAFIVIYILILFVSIILGIIGYLIIKL